MDIMPKLARVSSKGQVVIPAPLRKKLKISSAVIIDEEDGKIVMRPSMSFKEAFGSGGKELIEAARDLHKDRRREVESQRKKLLD